MADLSSIAVNEAAGSTPGQGPSATSGGSAPNPQGNKRPAPTDAGARSTEGGATKARRTDPDAGASPNQESQLERARQMADMAMYAELEKRKLILKIKAWTAAFSDLVGDIVKGMDLEKLEVGALKSLLDQIKFTVATRTTGIVTQSGAESILLLGEELLTTHTSLKVKGPAARLGDLSKDKNFQDLVKETTLDYADWIYSKPIYRLIYYAGQATWSISETNKSVGAQMEENDRISREKGAAAAIEESRRLREAQE